MNKIAIIGTGYVGLVTGAGMAEFGNKVICTDIDQIKIDNINSGAIPIYEPGLEEIINRNMKNNRLSFSSNIEESILESDVIVIAVGTPLGESGQADMSFVFSVAKTISKNINDYKIIVTKSTVPIGSGIQIVDLINGELNNPKLFDYVSNPEFLREGSALKDFLWPDRVIIGTNSEKAYKVMRNVYRPLYINKNPIVHTSIETAEMIKYASNSFLALKISYINEIANLCEAVGADVHKVANAMGQDGRISDKFLHPGPGFGGSCFPKDLEALLSISEKNNVKLETVESAIIANRKQKKRMEEKLVSLFSGDIKKKTIAVLGLSFKANTDDVRESPSINMINSILSMGGFVNAYDPIANNEMAKVINNINYFDSLYDAVNDADAAVVMTEWNEFRSLDLKKIKSKMRGNVILDTRNIINMKELSGLGFIYDNVGRIKK